MSSSSLSCMRCPCLSHAVPVPCRVRSRARAMAQPACSCAPIQLHRTVDAQRCTAGHDGTAYGTAAALGCVQPLGRNLCSALDAFWNVVNHLAKDHPATNKQTAIQRTVASAHSRTHCGTGSSTAATVVHLNGVPVDNAALDPSPSHRIACGPLPPPPLGFRRCMSAAQLATVIIAIARDGSV